MGQQGGDGMRCGIAHMDKLGRAAGHALALLAVPQPFSPAPAPPGATRHDMGQSAEQVGKMIHNKIEGACLEEGVVKGVCLLLEKGIVSHPCGQLLVRPCAAGAGGRRGRCWGAVEQRGQWGMRMGTATAVGGHKHAAPVCPCAPAASLGSSARRSPRAHRSRRRARHSRCPTHPTPACAPCASPPSSSRCRVGREGWVGQVEWRAVLPTGQREQGKSLGWEGRWEHQRPAPSLAAACDFSSSPQAQPNLVTATAHLNHNPAQHNRSQPRSPPSPLAPHVGLPHRLPLARLLLAPLGQQALPQVLQARQEGHLHLHVWRSRGRWRGGRGRGGGEG